MKKYGYSGAYVLCGARKQTQKQILKIRDYVSNIL